MYLKHAEEATWTPKLQGISDFSIVEFVLTIYRMKVLVKKINMVR
jgi:hypothetical protein